MMKNPLLDVRHISQIFSLGAGQTIEAVHDVSFAIQVHETVGLIGESGCGKSTLARILMGLYEPAAGDIYFKDMHISDHAVRKTQRRIIQREMHMIFQDADGALNPRMTAADSIREGLVLAGKWKNAKDGRQQIEELLRSVGLDRRYGQACPGELSGGQQQRVAIARCLGIAPSLIIADEPIAALDVSIQAQIINLLKDLQEQQHFSMLFIAHDLAVVRYISDRTAVMYGGRLVEISPTEELFQQPLHPYTKLLLASILKPDPAYERQKRVPAFDHSLLSLKGAMTEVMPGHFVLCHAGKA